MHMCMYVHTYISFINEYLFTYLYFWLLKNVLLIIFSNKRYTYVGYTYVCVCVCIRYTYVYVVGYCQTCAHKIAKINDSTYSRVQKKLMVTVKLM